MHRAQLPRISSVRSNLTLFIASWYAGRYGCSLGKLNRFFIIGPTETFAHARVDVKPMSISFMCIPCRNKAWIAAASSACPKYSAFRQLMMIRWGGALGAEQRWAVCWACLLKSFGAEQILHTRWPTEIFAHACVEIKSMSTDFMCIPSRNKA